MRPPVQPNHQALDPRSCVKPSYCGSLIGCYDFRILLFQYHSELRGRLSSIILYLFLRQRGSTVFITDTVPASSTADKPAGAFADALVLGLETPQSSSADA